MVVVPLQFTVQTQEVAASREIRHNLVENHLRFFVACFGETIRETFPRLFVELICSHCFQRFGNLRSNPDYSVTSKFV